MRKIFYKFMTFIIHHTRAGRAILKRAARAGYEAGMIQGHTAGTREAWLLAGEVVSLGDEKRADVFGQGGDIAEILGMPYTHARQGYDAMLKSINVFTRGERRLKIS